MRITAFDLIKRKQLKLRIEPGDELYMKDTFKKYFTKDIGLMFRESMGAFNGQRVKVLSVIKTHDEQKEPTYSFVAVRTEGLKQSERFPLICIDKRMPLIRNGRKISMLNKDLYILIK